MSPTVSPVQSRSAGTSTRQALSLYSQESLGTRLFVRARHLLCPLERVAQEVPAQGAVLDLGCGHGLFANLLALQSPARQVLGVDPAPAKIGVAQRSGRPLPNVSFRLGTIEDVAEGPFDAITILDVLYLLPYAQKKTVLEGALELLKPSGVLVLKTNDKRPWCKYQFARLQEVAMTRLGLTMGSGLHFLSAEENRSLLESVGFRPRTVYLPTRLPYPHVMFIAGAPGR